MSQQTVPPMPMKKMGKGKKVMSKKKPKVMPSFAKVGKSIKKTMGYVK